MDRKDGRDKRASPKGAGHLPQNQKKCDHRRGVEKDIGEMMSGGIQSVKLAVQHVGKPGQRMPVVGMNAGESPNYPLQRQTPGNLRVFIHIIIVVIVNELVNHRLAENGKGDRGQQNAHRRHPPVSNPATRADGGF